MFSLMFCLLLGMAVATTASKYSVGQSYSVPIGLVGCLPEMNANRAIQPHLDHKAPSKSGVEKNDAFLNLVVRGWATELPAQAVLINDKGTVARDGSRKGCTAKAVIAHRLATIEAYSAAGKEAEASICREIWLEKDGKTPIVPIFLNNSGFTRILSLPEVILEKTRRASADGKSFNPASFTVQLVVKDFSTEAARLEEQAFENEAQKMGVPTSTLDKLKTVEQMVAAEASSADVKRTFGNGTGSKLWSIVTADRRLPKLRLIERLNMPQPDNFVADMGHYDPTGYIPVGSIPQMETTLRDANSVEAAENYLVEKVFQKQNAAKVLTKDQWEKSATTLGIEAGSPMDLIRECHIKGRSLREVYDKYPQLFKAGCVLSLAEVKDVPTAPAAKGRKHTKA